MAEARTPARMARLVAQWLKIGESGASFARRHRMSTWTFGIGGGSWPQPRCLRSLRRGRRSCQCRSLRLIPSR